MKKNRRSRGLPGFLRATILEQGCDKSFSPHILRRRAAEPRDGAKCGEKTYYSHVCSLALLTWCSQSYSTADSPFPVYLSYVLSCFCTYLSVLKSSRSPFSACLINVR